MADFRVLLFRQDGTPEGELSKDAGTLLSCTRSEEINGEHSLSLTTERHMEVGTRALTHHADGRWREWVVDEPAETHDTGDHAVGTYHLCWSLQYDLQATYGPIQAIGTSPMPTVNYDHTYVSPDSTGNLEVNYHPLTFNYDYDVDWTIATSARTALSCAIEGSVMWGVGTCDVDANAYNVVMEADSSAWDRLTTVVKYWGGEVDAEIGVGVTGVTSRKVALRRHLGSTDARRRFEWGHDLTGITRTPDPGPYYCRYIPLGDGESEEMADGSTFEVPLSVRSEPTFVDSANGLRHDRGDVYIRDTQSELAFRKKGVDGRWEYPTTVVSFSTDDPAELMEMARQDVIYKTRPGISYSGDVANFAAAGMDTDGICLGDEVQVVDTGFNPDAALRVQERILKMEVDEMGVDDAKFDIGKLTPRLERTFATTIKTVGIKTVSYNKPIWDSTKFEEETPTLSHYKVGDYDSEGIEYNAPTVDYDIPDYGSAISDLQSQISDIYGGGADIGTGVGDDIIHQFNGVTMTEGVINFTTASDTGDGQGFFPKNPGQWGTNAASGKGSVFDKGPSWGSGSGSDDDGDQSGWTDMGGGMWGTGGGDF